MMMLAISDTQGTITLNSSLDGRQAACYGEVVTYTCTVTGAVSISWTATPNLTDPSLVQFFARTNNSQVTLTSVGPAADLTSTFVFTATVALNGTRIQCNAMTKAGTETDNQELIVAGMYRCTTCANCTSTEKQAGTWHHICVIGG